MSFYRSMASGDEDWRELYEMIGRIVVTSNTAHWCVFEMMGILLNTSRADTTPIYYTLKADSAQRDLTLAIAQDRLVHPEEEPLLAKLTAEVNALGRLSGQRNAFIHSHWTMEHYGDELHRFSVEGKPHPKLELSNPLDQARRVIGEIDAAIDRLIAICDELEEAPSVLSLCEQMGGRRR